MPIPQELLDKYRAFLIGTKGRSENTVRVYSDDLATFNRYLELQNVDYDRLDRRFLRRNIWLGWQPPPGASAAATPGSASHASSCPSALSTASSSGRVW